jgi:hypothetical protein
MFCVKDVSILRWMRSDSRDMFLYVFFLVPSLSCKTVGWILVAFFVCLSRTASLEHIFSCSLDIPCMSASHISFSLRRWMKNWNSATIQMAQHGKFRAVDILVAHAACPGHRGDISLFSPSITSPGLPYPWYQQNSHELSQSLLRGRVLTS